MADENTENTEAAVDQAAAEAAEATEETTEAAAEATPEAPAEEAAAEPKVEGPPADLSPSQRRQWYRQRSGNVAKPPRSPEERARERAEARKAKAVARRRRRLQERERKKADPAHPRTGTPAVEREPGRVQIRQGVVSSATGDKTIIVRIDAQKRHPKYHKIVRSSSKLQAHDENNEAGVGDTVRVRSSRPMSKTKRWALAEIVERAK